MKRIWFIVFIGLAGTACLLYLGKWQIDRLNWKLDVLKKIDQKIVASPVLLSPLILQVFSASLMSITTFHMVEILAFLRDNII